MTHVCPVIPAEDRTDPYIWWEDKQVAVEVAGALVRGWVLECRRVGDPVEGQPGRMTIVLLISPPKIAALYPDVVVVDVVDDGGHGRPRKVRGLWIEADTADVHIPAGDATRSPAPRVGRPRAKPPPPSSGAAGTPP